MSVTSSPSLLDKKAMGILAVLYPNGKPRSLGPIESFSISALAPAVAVVFTNPFDTAKVRLQLQGQYLKKQANAPKIEAVYKNSFDALVKIYSNEGIRGLQKGLAPAILREGSKNLFRIGMFDPILSAIHDPSQGSAPAWKRILTGSFCGLMGAASCNPFELVKTRLQSASTGSMVVGHQHGYSGVTHALRSIYKQDGIKGLYRGTALSMARSIVGSGSNLASYSLMKEYLLVQKKWKDNAWLDMVCGLSSGFMSCLFMNPIDVVRTRYYNQTYIGGKGELYSSGLDAVTKIATNEGPTAFYKGFLSHFLRIGPHFCLTFVFLGMLRRTLTGYYGELDRKDIFSQFDIDKNGLIDKIELKTALEKILAPHHPPTSEESRSLSEYVDRIIEKADLDHDSAISFSEYESVEKELKAILLERFQK